MKLEKLVLINTQLERKDDFVRHKISLVLVGWLVGCTKLEQSVFSFQATGDCMPPQVTSTSEIQNGKTRFVLSL